MPGIVIGIRHHPDRPDLIRIDSPPEAANIMGGFQPAQYVGLKGGAYTTHTDQLDNFTTYAKHHNVTIIDHRHQQSTPPPVGPPIPLPECAHCGQPDKNNPQYCPACGKQWQPIRITHRTADLQPLTTCTHCHKPQPDTRKYCRNCGTPNQPQLIP